MIRSTRMFFAGCELQPSQLYKRASHTHTQRRIDTRTNTAPAAAAESLVWLSQARRVGDAGLLGLAGGTPAQPLVEPPRTRWRQVRKIHTVS